MTKPEVVLWTRLKGRGCLGYKFRRQHSFGPYIVDFYCHALYLAVEVDGSQHFESEAMCNDRERTRYLNSLQIEVIRFTNSDVLTNLAGVVDALEEALQKRRRSWASPPATTVAGPPPP